MRLSHKQFAELMLKKGEQISEHKYRAKKCTEDGIRFSSIAEKEYYKLLKMLKQIGVVSFFFDKSTLISLVARVIELILWFFMLMDILILLK